MNCCAMVKADYGRKRRWRRKLFFVLQLDRPSTGDLRRLPIGTLIGQRLYLPSVTKPRPSPISDEYEGYLFPSRQIIIQANLVPNTSSITLGCRTQLATDNAPPCCHAYLRSTNVKKSQAARASKRGPRLDSGSRVRMKMPCR